MLWLQLYVHSMLSSYGLIDLDSPQPDVKCFGKDIPESYVVKAVVAWVHSFTVSLKV